MKQAFAILSSASFVVVIGCSDYDIRMDKTFTEMKYQKRLNESLGLQLELALQSYSNAARHTA